MSLSAVSAAFSGLASAQAIMQAAAQAAARMGRLASDIDGDDVTVMASGPVDSSVDVLQTELVPQRFIIDVFA